jgi:hypothetical protein
MGDGLGWPRFVGRMPLRLVINSICKRLADGLPPARRVHYRRDFVLRFSVRRSEPTVLRRASSLLMTSNAINTHTMTSATRSSYENERRSSRSTD